MFGVTDKDPIIKAGKTSYYIWAAFAIGIVLAFCAMMAWQQFFGAVEIPQDGKYLRERAALEAEAEQLRTERQAIADTNAMLLDSIKVLLTKPKEIHHTHETTRKNNWALDDSAAIILWRTRIAAEHEYRQRFRYDY